jgi:hydrogenase nickel incorporation protein HypA/HybF
MHELAITRGLISEVLAGARRSGAKRVVRVNVAVGEAGGVVPDCVQFYFDQLKAGTEAETAVLSFRTVPLRIRCPRCGREFGAVEEMCACNAGGDVLAGQDLVIESIDVE